MAKGGGSGKSASASASKAVDAYTGPTDAYGNPTSAYSVLRPGATTVAGGAPANDNRGGYAGLTRTVVIQGDTLNINGGADKRTAEELEAVLNQRDKRLIQETRYAVAADNAARANRQTIGGV